ncbi:MAG: glycosyltransferase [Oscillospiraceae bacterium]|jgi:glycosyltransferase involved in cell wall biosynthesis|nr:glycosyltransferase [Oscillospiraceae bacterium]
MKPRILITCLCMETGGVEHSLVELLNAFDYDRFDVDLLLFARKGPLLAQLPPQCRLLPEDPRSASLLKPIRQVLLQGHPLLALARLVAKLFVRRRFPVPPNDGDGVTFALLQNYWKNLLPLLPKRKQRYDTVISFQWPHHYAAKKVTARQKLAWVHTDHSRAVLDKAADEAVWACFDQIACVSQGVLERFCLCYPALRDRCFVFENLLNPATLRAKAEAFTPEDMPPLPGGFRLLTVGRYCHAKAFDRAILICRALAARGVKLRWYAIGFGLMEEQLRQSIARFGLEEVFILLGWRENPYPYMKACELYVQPSRYEGKAVTVMEAMTLGKPVVITDFATADAQVRDGVDARIIPQEPPEDAAAAIADLLNAPQEMRSLATAAAAEDHSGFAQLEALYSLLEEERT